MKVPQGVEKVVALATLGSEWRAKVLADPEAAAREAGIELAEAEREILRAVSARMLAGMIDSFGKSVPRPAGLSRLAAGAAAAALLLTSLSGCGDNPPPCRPGIPPDVPKPKPPAPAPADEPRKENPDQPPPPAGIRSDAPPSKAPPPTKDTREDGK